MPKRIPQETRDQIESLAREGVAYAEIARRTGVCTMTAQKIGKAVVGPRPVGFQYQGRPNLHRIGGPSVGTVSTRPMSDEFVAYHEGQAAVRSIRRSTPTPAAITDFDEPWENTAFQADLRDVDGDHLGGDRLRHQALRELGMFDRIGA